MATRPSPCDNFSETKCRPAAFHTCAEGTALEDLEKSRFREQGGNESKHPACIHGRHPGSTAAGVRARPAGAGAAAGPRTAGPSDPAGARRHGFHTRYSLVSACRAALHPAPGAGSGAEQFSAPGGAHPRRQADAASGRRHPARHRKQPPDCRAALHHLDHRYQRAPRQEWLADPQCAGLHFGAGLDSNAQFRSPCLDHAVLAAAVHPGEQPVPVGNRTGQPDRPHQLQRSGQLLLQPGLQDRDHLHAVVQQHAHLEHVAGSVLQSCGELAAHVQLYAGAAQRLRDHSEYPVHHRGQEQLAGGPLRARQPGDQHRHAGRKRLLEPGLCPGERQSAAGQRAVGRAESELATDRQNLIVAQTSELQLQTQLLNLITRNPLAAGLENVEVVPLDSINVPPRIDILPYREAVQEALANRPDLLAQELQLKNADIEVRATRNALLPTVSLFGQYGASGLGGNTLRTVSVPTAFGPNRNAPVVDSNGNPVLVNGQPVYAGTPVAFQTTSTLLTGGLLDAFDAVWHNRFPTYAFGLSMSIPLRNRAAQADNAQALLQQRLSMLQLQALRNQIASDVRNAQIAIQQGLARVEAAQKARELAQQTLEAEQKKFQLGVSTNFLVIQAARDLVTAEGNELQARVALRQALVNFNQVLGRTLKVYNITIADALSGHYSRALNIPGTPEPAFTESHP